MAKNRKKQDTIKKRRALRHGVRSAGLVFARLFLATAVVGVTFAAVIGGYLWGTSSPRFSVRDVHVEGAKRASIPQLAELTGIESATNIFLVNPADCARRIETHPWVRRATVRRDFPGTVYIDIEEHDPVALIALGPLYLVDRQGVVFKRVSWGDPVDFPVITGLMAGDPTGPALDVLDAWRVSAASQQLAEIHLDPLHGAILTLAADEEGPPIVVHLGHQEFPRRLQKLRQLTAVLSERGERPKEVFLDNHTRPQWVVARVD